MAQRELFRAGEGDAWFRRNPIEGEAYERHRASDPVIATLSELPAEPRSVLEIGASNGWRLKALRSLWPAARMAGVEPSAAAVSRAPEGVELAQGTADHLPFPDASFELVLFGFCLYLCDRADLFRIAAEADRVLLDGGHLAVYDFFSETPYRNEYHHAPGAFSYKMDYSRLFGWNPAYAAVSHRVMAHPGMEDTPDNRVAVHLFRKDVAAGWPDRVR